MPAGGHVEQGLRTPGRPLGFGASAPSEPLVVISREERRRGKRHAVVRRVSARGCQSRRVGPSPIDRSAAPSGAAGQSTSYKHAGNHVATSGPKPRWARRTRARDQVVGRDCNPRRVGAVPTVLSTLHAPVLADPGCRPLNGVARFDYERAHLIASRGPAGCRRSPPKADVSGPTPDREATLSFGRIPDSGLRSLVLRFNS
jgi:hypothetical protein